MCGAPGNFSATRDVDGMVHFTWTKPDDITYGNSVDGYIITASNYFDHLAPKGKQSYDITNGDTNATSIQLDKETSYMFEITAYAGEYVSQARKSECLLPKHAFLNQSTKLEGLLMPTYLIATRDTSKYCDICRKEIGKRPVSGVARDEKVILVVGETGSGKSTWINAILNYVLGVKYTDNFRYKMVVDENVFHQACNQTQDVTIYTIHHQEGFMIDFTLTIIDTPRFGDMKDITKDKELETLFKSTFDADVGGVDHLDALCFVAYSSSTQLSQRQKYTYTSILSLFGVDIKDNVFMCFTVSDGHVPHALHAVKKEELPYDESYDFNNSAIFSGPGQGGDGGDDHDEMHGDLNRILWDLGMWSFKKFLQKIHMTKTKKLATTRCVLNERERLEIQVLDLRKHVTKGLTYMELQDELRSLETIEMGIDSSKDYTYSVKMIEMGNKPVAGNQNITTSIMCSFTCNETHALENNDENRKCIAINTNDDSQQCKGKYRRAMCGNIPYIYEENGLFVICTKEEIKARYKEAYGHRHSRDLVVKKIQAELDAVKALIKASLLQITCSLQRLKETSLHGDLNTRVEYLDLLLQTETSEAKPGWQERVERLKDLLQQAQDICDIDTGVYDPFKGYRESAEDQNIIITNGLTMTSSLSGERERLEIQVVNLNQQVRQGISYMLKLRNELRLLTTAERDIERSEDYAYKTDKFEGTKKSSPGDEYATTCVNRNYEDCACGYDVDKINCEGKCRRNVRRNRAHIYGEKGEFVTCTKDEIKARYEQTCGQNLKIERTVSSIEKELNAVEAHVKTAMSEISRIMDTLHEIARHDDPTMYMEYLELLVETERAKARPGWQKRVSGLIGLCQNSLDTRDTDAGKHDLLKMYIERLKEANKLECDVKTSTSLGVFGKLKLKWATQSLGRRLKDQ